MSARRLFGAGLLLALCALGLIAIAPADALRGWLAALFLWSGVPIGALGFIMAIRIIGGRWGHSLLPFFEAGALTLPIIAIGVLPVFAGMALLYPWVGTTLPGFKGAWLSPVPFILRTLLLFGGLGWALWALITRRGSAVAISSAGLLFLVPMNSLVLVDWVVSLDASFHSSGFGLYAMSIQFTVALMMAVGELLRRQPQHTAALAAIIITLILIWLYLAFTSYFVIWSGNLASLVGWYQVRSHGGWGIGIAISTIIEAFAFALLLSPTIRHSPKRLRMIAAAMIVGKIIEAAWLVLPQAGTHPMSVLAYMLATGGLGLIIFQAQRMLLDYRVRERAPA